MKKSHMIVFGSALTFVSGMVTIFLLNYKKENPRNLDIFSIEKASAVKIKNKDKWISTSMFLCTNNKGEHVMVINKDNKTIAIRQNKIISIGEINNNLVTISFKNSFGVREEIQIECDESDFGRAFAYEIGKFALMCDFCE